MPFLKSILKNNAEKFKHEPALSMKMGFRFKTFSYAQIYELSKRLAILLQKNGVRKGDKIIICAPNSPYWICVEWASLLLGCVIVPINIQSTENFVLKIIEETRAKIIFKHAFFKFELPNDIKQLTIDYIEEELENISSEAFKEPETSSNDIVILMYTSGTTGDPKGVMLTNKNIYSNLQSIANIIKLSHKHDIILSILPLSHIFEQTIGFFLPFLQGVPIVYLHSYSAIRSLMKRKKITKMVAVPAFLKLLMTRIESEATETKKLNLLNKLRNISRKINNKKLSRILFAPVLNQFGGKIETIASGGSELDPILEKKWNMMGVDILQGYGLTETSPVITLNTYQHKKMGSVGKAVQGVEIKIAEDKEILVSGPTVFKGYYKNEKKTAEVFTHDGWFKTGDLGELDADNFLYIKGRKKYMILGPGGQNVYPEDIEHELNKIEYVKDSCVIDLKNENGFIAIHAVLLLDENQKPSPKKIIEQANDHLASYQKINNWTVWQDQDFPRTVTRKIKKEDVRKFIEKTKNENHKKSDKAESKIVRILSRITGIDSNKIDESSEIISDLNLDSLGRVELVTWIEADLGTVINETDITAKTTVKDLEQLIKTKGISQEETPELKKWPCNFWIFPFRIIIQYFIFFFGKFFIKLKVEGRENLKNLPLPVIFMPNHISYLDSVVVSQALPFKIRIRSAFAAATDFLYESYKLLTPITEIGFNTFPMERREHANVRYGLEFIGQMLDRNYSVVIFPEGELSKSGKLKNLKKGTGLLVTQMDAYVVPIKIEGTADIIPYGKFFPRKRGQVTIKFGKPLKYKKSENFVEAAREIETAMKEL